MTSGRLFRHSAPLVRTVAAIALGVGLCVPTVCAADPWQIIFTFHTRTNTHPLKWLDVVSAHDDGNSGPAARYALINNGTEPVTEGRLVSIEKSPNTRAPDITWDLVKPSASCSAQRTGYATRVEVLQRGNYETFFETAGGPGNISVKVYTQDGELQGELEDNGDYVKAERYFTFDTNIVADKLLRSLVSETDLLPPSSSRNCGGHIVIDVTPIVLKEVELWGKEVTIHGKVEKYLAIAREDGDFNISDICEFTWTREKWGDYWVDPATWTSNTFTDHFIRNHRSNLNLAWDMGNPHGATIPKAAFGPHKKSLTTLYASARYDQQSATMSLPVNVSKGRFTSDNRIITVFPISSSSSERILWESLPKVPRSAGIKSKVGGVDKTLYPTAEGRFAYELLAVMEGWKAGLGVSQVSNPVAALIFNVLTTVAKAYLETKLPAYEVEDDAIDNPFGIAVSWQYRVFARKDTTTQPTGEQILYNSGIHERAYSGDKIETVIVPLETIQYVWDFKTGALMKPSEQFKNN